MDWIAYFSPQALLFAVGWGVASGMAIPHLQTGREHRLRSLALLLICCLGLVVALVAGARQQEQALRTDDQQKAIAAGVARIAAALSVTTAASAKNAAPDHVLVTVADRIQQQNLELAALRQQVGRIERLPPNPDVLYKGDVPMAVVDAPIINTGARRIVFKTVMAHADLDTSTPFLFRRWLVECAPSAHTGVITGTIDSVKYWDLRCTIEP
jgi:hypothetical protein